ncbi:MAG: hypothetical protein WDA09_02975, partial [Bacteriovoracaceae bacterium]
GWKAETYRIIEKDKKGKEKDKGWTCDLIPKELVVARYFSKEQEELNQATSELESVSALIAEMSEEHGGDEGAFSELEKINKANAAARLKEIAKDKEAKEEAELLIQYIALCDQEAELKKKVKELDSKLDELAMKQYSKLKIEDVKTLVVEDKWMASLAKDVHGELERISQSLTSRIKELAERYESAMPELIKEASLFESKVNKHLEQMGFAWN